jgi:hypothetical protein
MRYRFHGQAGKPLFDHIAQVKHIGANSRSFPVASISTCDPSWTDAGLATFSMRADLRYISKETNAPIGSPPDVRQTVPQERGRCLGGRYWTVLGSQIAPDERHQKVAGHQLVDHSPTGRTFRRYVCPERSIPADSLAVHGLSAEFSVCARRPSRRVWRSSGQWQTADRDRLPRECVPLAGPSRVL